MDELRRQLRQIGRKARRQVGKDYVLFPLLTGPFFLRTLAANACANLIRNVWTYTIIFCNHFPDGAQHFTEDELENETRPEWYLRQMLGAANIEGGRLFHIMSGNLGFQIEHHLYPDLPSNRYAEISVRVRDLCERYRIPYTSGPLHRQYGQVIRKILRLSLPDSLRKGTSSPLAKLVQLPHRRRPEDRPGRRLETGGWFGRSVA
jgi:linoleoyl-CoA desaturase